VAKSALDRLWEELGLVRPKTDTGFANRSSEFASAMGRKGGLKAQANKTAHTFTRAEAKAAGAKGLENRWAKWRAEKAVAQAEFIQRMRQKLAESGETGAPSREQAAEVQREFERMVRASNMGSLSKGARSVVEAVLRGRVDAIERAIAPEAAKIAPTIDVAREIEKLDQPLEQQIAEARREQRTQLSAEDQAEALREARKAAMLAELRGKSKK
jgi:hypothetical protein